MFCGPDSITELSGTATSIDTGSMVLALPAGEKLCPEPGEQVRLELLLPISEEQAAAKCLAVRAQ